MKKIALSIFFAFSVAIAASAQTGQDRAPHEVYSMMVFNFTKYVQWPDHSGSGDFIIGVVGNNEIYATLNAWYGGKPRGTKTYVIKKFNSAADLTDCNVIFIDKSKSNEFEGIKAKISGKGTLLITDKNGLGSRGSAINFTTVDDKLKFELNQKAVETANLKVASSLAAMAILI